MKILIVNTFDFGGAANACLRLHEGLLSDGIDSNVLLLRKQNHHPRTYQIDKQEIPKSKIGYLKQKTISALRKLKLISKPKETEEQKFLKSRRKELELFSFPYSEYDITKSPLYEQADIINLHWVAKFLDYDTFFRKNTKPVVWTLHDMNPFTGGEHYEEIYLGMDNLGNPMSRIQSALEKLMSQKILTIKNRVISSEADITVVAPSKWLVKEAKNSSIFKSKPVLCIPYGLNPELFNIRDRNLSRETLNIPKDKQVILFVADSVKNHRKGFQFLNKIFEQLDRDDVILCAISAKKRKIDTTANIIELGAIHDEKMMSMAYSAADVFVIPSLMDNLPNTVLESLMCGTPVIGFPVGGIPDMIQHGQNGMLTKEISSSALLETLNDFFRTISSFDRILIRESAIKKYDLNIQSQAYIKLFNSILKN